MAASWASVRLVPAARKEVGRAMWSPGLPQALDWRARGPATPRLLPASTRTSGRPCLVAPLASVKVVAEQCSGRQCSGTTTVHWAGARRHDRAAPTTLLVLSKRPWGGQVRTPLLGIAE